MSLDKNNQVFKKTSFLTGFNSAYIEEYYSTYLENPELLPKDWMDFFDGLKDDTEKILKNIKGPSWSPNKTKLGKLKKIETKSLDISAEELSSVKQASQDSVRAIMLVRAYRIRGHLIANLDPLDLQKKEEHPELKPETYGFTKKDYKRKNLFRWSSWSSIWNFEKNIRNLKKNLLLNNWI